MLSGIKSSTGHGTMHVRPCPDHDCVDFWRGDQFLPGCEPRGDLEFLGDSLCGLRRTVHHADDLDPFDFAETGNVAQSRIGPGANDSDPNTLL